MYKSVFKIRTGFSSTNHLYWSCHLQQLCYKTLFLWIKYGKYVICI